MNDAALPRNGDARLSRRSFLKVASVAGGGLAVGLLLDGCAHVQGAQALGGGFHPNAWLRVAPDDTITFLLDRAEMGQGVLTSHVQLLCEELAVAPARVVVELAPADFDRFGVQVTGGSTSTTSQFDVLRQAGATARELLRRAAARRWGVALDEVTAADGALVHAAKGRLRYGEVASAATREWVHHVPLKEPSAWTVIGTSPRRLDAAAKTDGSAVYGMDVKQHGLLTAVVLRPPTLRGSVLRYDAARALAAPGVRDVVAIPQGVAVVADGYWHARKAAALVDVEWQPGPLAGLSTDALKDERLALLERPAQVVTSHGDVDTALAHSKTRVRAVYQVPFLAHAPMEPLNATAHVEPERVRVWVGTQAPAVVQAVAARITGMPNHKVEVHSTLLGGGFGRRALPDFAAEAVEVSLRLKAPVKVVWSREDDLRHGQYRPAALALVEGGVDESGAPIAWRHRLVTQSLVASFADLVGAMSLHAVPQPILELVGEGVGRAFLEGHVIDPTAVEGAAELPYALPHRRLEIALHDCGVPVTAWRSVGHSINAFVVESFVDELAHAGGRDPLALRRALLVDHPRNLAVLETAARAIGWHEPPAPGRFRGLAQHHCFGSWCAQAVEISVADGLRVHRVVCAIDCGRVVNPDLVAAQMESGVIFGLSAALSQHIDLDQGKVRQSNFHDYPMLRMHEAPTVETHIVASDERPTGVGELAVPPLAPALANAFFAATGVRLRSLPLLADAQRVLAGEPATSTSP